MTRILQTWTGLAAIGAALIHLALGAGAPFSLLGIYVIVGFAELVWGVLVLRLSAVPAPRVALVGAALPILVWAAGAAAAGMTSNPGLATSLAFAPLAVASLFDLLIIVALLTALRAPAVAEDPARGSGRSIAAYLAGLGVGALVVGYAVSFVIALTPVGAGMAAGAHTGHGGMSPSVESLMPMPGHDQQEG